MLARNLPPLFKSNFGYSDETITTDTRYLLQLSTPLLTRVRFKLERALDKAGLLNTKYAQEVLSSVQTKVRIDQLSSEQKEVYIKTHVA